MKNPAKYKIGDTVKITITQSTGSHRNWDGRIGVIESINTEFSNFILYYIRHSNDDSWSWLEEEIESYNTQLEELLDIESVL